MHGRRRFNPRPHGAGDAVVTFGNVVPASHLVSIHARTGRATNAYDSGQLTIWEAFQSTPAHGGRLATAASACDGSLSSYRFNPRPHGAGDSTRQKTFTNQPKKCFNPRPHGAGDFELRGCYGNFKLVCFNPRPHGAGDEVSSESNHGRPVQKFQSTPARGGRLRYHSSSAHWAICSFNPRPHTAGDDIPHWPSIRYSCFNPRPHTAGDPRRPT